MSRRAFSACRWCAAAIALGNAATALLGTALLGTALLGTALLGTALLGTALGADDGLGADAGWPPRIERRVPPPGIALPAERRAQIEGRLRAVRGVAEPLRSNPLFADVDVYLKAVELAVEIGEFFRPQDAQLALDLLDTAEQRARQLASEQTPWRQQRGLVVRGFRSQVDGASQPYGLDIAEGLDLERPTPVVIWLHGRGDKTTDLHFIRQRETRPGPVRRSDAIVIHPFGRQCIGYKSAGEADVWEALEHLATQYPIDRERIALMGFSMGGAGAWHLGAHFAGRLCALAPGAGFAETAEYNRLAPAAYPRETVQRLWGQYDAPAAVRNLFNIPVVTAYSGELDRQIQAARVMERAYQAEGRTLEHLIGPGMGHKYHPESLAAIQRRISAALEAGREATPREVELQTRTLKYSRQRWVEATGLLKHWSDSRVAARITGERSLRVETINVSRLRLDPWPDMNGVTGVIDGQEVAMRGPQLFQAEGRWRAGAPATPELSKRPGLQGPIDDAFSGPFLVVTPSGKSPQPRVQRWIEFESERLRQRWRALFRGRIREKLDRDVTEDDIQRFHLIVWGDPSSNAILQRALASEEGAPRPLGGLEWRGAGLALGGAEFDATTHVPALIYPNPLNPQRYLVVNSGPTFREGHDRTNSLQNPQAPDWVVWDLRQPPTDLAAGRLAAEGFFDEQWK